MTPPLISVIIPSYNSARFLAESIGSVLAQTYRPLEIVVIDDGSTDATSEAVAPYANRIRYIRQENRGLAGARNRGIQETRGEFIAFLDADDQWMPEKLARQWKCFCDHPSVPLVHTDTLCWNEDVDEIVPQKLGRSDYVGDCYRRLFFENYVTPSTVVVRRDCIEMTGLFHDGLPGVEDLDLWLRIARHYPFGYVDEPLVQYRIHNLNMSKNDLQMRRGELIALERALAADPALVSKIGTPIVRQRLYKLSLGVGYHYFDQGDFLFAREFLSKALSYRPGQLYPIALWSATWLPSAAIRTLRRIKQQMCLI